MIKKIDMLKYVYILTVLALFSLDTEAQQLIQITGSVTDYLLSKPIGEANVSIKGSVLKNTNTSADGRFRLEVPSAFATLIVAFPGYQTREVPLHGLSDVSVTLFPEDMEVGESIINLPYETVNEKDINGAHSIVFNNNDRARDLTQLLQGTVPGLEANNYSGTPGEGVRFNLRGIRSLYTTGEPLIVLDGVPLLNSVFISSVARGNVYNYLTDLNVKDISSVTVLRDPASAGMYGSRASNGVILITTRDGTAGKTYLDVSLQTSLTSSFKDIPMMGATDYLPYLSSKIYSQGLDQQAIDDRFPFFALGNNSGDLIYGNNTNWQQQVKQDAVNTDFYLSLKGGDATSKYSFNVGYNTAQGNIQEVSVNRFTSRFNIDFKMLKKFTAGARIAFNSTKKNLMDQGFEERVNPLYLSLVKSPVTSPYIQSSMGVNSEFYSPVDFDHLSNPVAVLGGVTNDLTDYWIRGNIYGKYDFSPSFSTKAMIFLDRRGLSEDRFTPEEGIIPINFDNRFDRTSESQMMSNTMMAFEHTFNYNKQFDTENRLGIIGGYYLELGRYDDTFGYSRHSTDDAFQALQDGTRVLVDGANEKYNNLSAFINGNYAFREKLLFTAGVRLDGSSKFGPEAKGLMIASVPFAVLPYANATWRLKAEPWFNEVNFLDEMDLRASVAMTANQDIPVNARYSLYGKSFYLINPGIAPISMGNNNVKWESTKSFNAGFDLSFFKKILMVNLDYYRTRTDDVLTRRVIDGAYGESFYWDNGGSIDNNGLEIGLSTLGHSGDFIWNLGVNIARYKNNVVKLPDHAPIIDGRNGYTSIVMEGRPAGLIYGYKYLGVFSTGAEAEAAGLKSARSGTFYRAGDVHYADVNNDHLIDDRDKQVIGDPNPDLYGGINAALSYKNFDISTVFSFSRGNDVLNVLRSKLENGAAYENQSLLARTAWSSAGDIADIPVTAYGDPMGNQQISSLYVEDGSYLKMRTLTVAYNIRKQINFIRNAQIYVTGYNLLTITKYLGWDPEVAIGQDVFSRGYDFGNVPTSKTFLLGIKLGL